MSNLSEKRYGLITGSQCHVLFPKRKNEQTQITYAKELAKQKVFRYYDEVNTWQIEHGYMGEYVAMEWFQNNVDSNAIKPDFVSIGEFGGSADCITEIYGVDFKCPTSLGNWLDYLTDGISDQQYHQAQMYMHLYNKPLWKVIAYLAETERMNEMGETYPIDQDKRAIVIEVHKDDNWFNDLSLKSKFVLEKREEFVREYSKLI